MLTAITKRSEVRAAQERFYALLRRPGPITRNLGSTGATQECELYWHPNPGLWAALDDGGGSNRSWNRFGTSNPTEGNGTIAVSCEINIPTEGMNLQMTGIFAKDAAGTKYIAHTGRIGGGRKGINKTNLVEFFREKDPWTDIHWPDANFSAPCIVISALSDPDFIKNVYKFVRAVERFKASVTHDNVDREEALPHKVRGEASAAHASSPAARAPIREPGASISLKTHAEPPEIAISSPSSHPDHSDHKKTTVAVGTELPSSVPTVPMLSSTSQELQALEAPSPSWPANLPQMFASAPNTELVIATLDAEMARLEQSVTRSGWTSWAGTAALGGIAWVFVTLLDASTAFPWHTFLITTTLLSFVQDFIYGVDYALRPRRGLGLIIGGQTRIMLSKESLPFARKQYCFYLVRSALLAAASYMFLPTLFGWTWWFPFIVYTLVCVTMVISVVLSVVERPVPKHEKFNVGEFIVQALLLAQAVTALAALAESWQEGDFIALKAALLAIAAAHVLRGLAEPQFELPALDKLREIRRKLGFGQILPIQAVAQAEAALFGQPSLIIISPEILAFTQACEGFASRVSELSNRVTTLGARVQAMRELPKMRLDDVRIAEALLRDLLAAQRDLTPVGDRYTETRQSLVSKLDHYKKNTQNDASIPVVDAMIAENGKNFVSTAMKMLANFKLFIMHTRSLEQLAAEHKLTIAPELHAAVDAMQGHISSQIAKLQQTPKETT